VNKISAERNILGLAKPLLGELYGHFHVDPEQTDRPDAAIILGTTDGRIGIEITSVDGEDFQQYFNDEKFGKAIKVKKINDLVFGGDYSNHPEKKASIPFRNSYIADGVLKKYDKHSDYLESGEYEEVILISFSEVLEIRSRNFNSYHKPWTWHLLKEKSFPFSKVIFVCKQHGDAALVYDKNIPAPAPPERDPDKELGVTRISGAILPAGKKINLYDIFDSEPLINLPQKNKKKAKRKANRKAQGNARKVNRKK
tara:strand:- start:2801 stop:3565 length:765 start_codon:yes stop_codon:yes gene_type:complete